MNGPFFLGKLTFVCACAKGIKYGNSRQRWLGKTEHSGQVDFLLHGGMIAASEEMTMTGQPRRNHSPAFKAKVA